MVVSSDPLVTEELNKLREENKRLRDENVQDFRMDELDAVMHSVDKWFNEGDPRLKDNPATRAADAREIALQAIGKVSSRAEKAEALLRETKRMLDDGFSIDEKTELYRKINAALAGKGE